MQVTVRPSERVGIVSCIDPDNYAGTTTVTGDVIDMRNWHSLMAILMVGDMVANGTVDYKLQAGTATNSTFYDITGKAVTQLTQAGTDDNKQVVINLKSEELASQSNADGRAYRYVRELWTPGTVTTDAGTVVLGFDPRYGPATDSDLTTVDEIVS